jgi:hypothetical protein
LEERRHILLNGPVKGVQGQDPQLGFIRGVNSALEEELDKVGDVLAENRNFL